MRFTVGGKWPKSKSILVTLFIAIIAVAGVNVGGRWVERMMSSIEPLSAPPSALQVTIFTESPRFWAKQKPAEAGWYRDVEARLINRCGRARSYVRRNKQNEQHEDDEKHNSPTRVSAEATIHIPAPFLGTQYVPRSSVDMDSRRRSIHHFRLFRSSASLVPR